MLSDLGGHGGRQYFTTLHGSQEKMQALQRLNNQTISFNVNWPKSVPGGTKVLADSYKRYEVEGERKEGKIKEK